MTGRCRFAQPPAKRFDASVIILLRDVSFLTATSINSFSLAFMFFKRTLLSFHHKKNARPQHALSASMVIPQIKKCPNPPLESSSAYPSAVLSKRPVAVRVCLPVLEAQKNRLPAPPTALSPSVLPSASTQSTCSTSKTSLMGSSFSSAQPSPPYSYMLCPHCHINSF